MRKWKTALSALLCLALLCGLIVPAGAADTVTVSYEVELQQSVCRQQLDMINEFRTGEDAWYWASDDTTKIQTNLQPLTWDYELEKVCLQRAAEIALSYSHTRPDGGSCFIAYSELGYSYSSAGENIAVGQTSSQAVFLAWREDNYPYQGQGHRRNMLGDFTRFAAACVYSCGFYYWVQEFSVSSKATQPTAALDGTATVSCRLALERILQTGVYCPNGEDSSGLQLQVGASADLPELKEWVKAEGYWNYRGYVPYVQSEAGLTCTIADESVAVIKSGSIVAKKNGTTSLKVTSPLGGTLEIPIIVGTHTHSFGAPAVTVEPGCGTEGERVSTCACGVEQVETLPATNLHHYIVDSGLLNWFEDSLISYHCIDCAASNGYYYEYSKYFGAAKDVNAGLEFDAAAGKYTYWVDPDLDVGVQIRLQQDVNADGKLNLKDAAALFQACTGSTACSEAIEELYSDGFSLRDVADIWRTIRQHS